MDHALNIIIIFFRTKALLSVISKEMDIFLKYVLLKQLAESPYSVLIEIHHNDTSFIFKNSFHENLMFHQ